jgi:flagellar biogenesis protein FliO
MIDRRWMRWSAAGLSFVLCEISPAAMAEQGSPAANGPITLSSTGSPSSPSIAVPTTTAVQGAAETLDAKTAAAPLLVVPPAVIAPAKAGPPDKALTTNESKPIGGTSLASAHHVDSPKSDTSAKVGNQTWAGADLLKVLGALAVVIGLAFIVRAILKRTGGLLPGADRPSGVVEILARYPIARGQQLVLLKLARRVLLLHQSGSAMKTLTEMSDPDEVAALLARMEAGSRGKSAHRFNDVLRGYESEHHQPEIHVQRPRSLATAPSPATEIVDLTRTQLRGLGGLLGRKVSR